MVLFGRSFKSLPRPDRSGRHPQSYRHPRHRQSPSTARRHQAHGRPRNSVNLAPLYQIDVYGPNLGPVTSVLRVSEPDFIVIQVLSRPDLSRPAGDPSAPSEKGSPPGRIRRGRDFCAAGDLIHTGQTPTALDPARGATGPLVYGSDGSAPDSPRHDTLSPAYRKKRPPPTPCFYGRVNTSENFPGRGGPACPPPQGAADKCPRFADPAFRRAPRRSPVVRAGPAPAETRPRDSPEQGSVAPSRASEMTNRPAACAG
jgi:hypothetical protein